MPTSLHAATHLPDPVEVVTAAFAGDPAAWLPLPARAAGVDCWTIELVAGRFRREVRCRTTAPWRTAEGIWRTLRWEPPDPADPGEVDRRLPVFAGELGIRLDGAPTLVLSGRYDPPGGGLGTVMDRLVLHHVADLTAREFLAAVRRHLAPARVAV